MTFMSNVLPEENQSDQDGALAPSRWQSRPFSICTLSNYFYMDNIIANCITSQSNQLVLFSLLNLPVWNLFFTVAQLFFYRTDECLDGYTLLSVSAKVICLPTEETLSS